MARATRLRPPVWMAVTAAVAIAAWLGAPAAVSSASARSAHPATAGGSAGHGGTVPGHGAADHGAADHGAADHGRPDRLALVPLSNPRPELVSGGEVLVRVEVPPGVAASQVRVFDDFKNVTSDFQAQADGSLLGLVTGLTIGRNRLVASADGQFAVADVIDHSDQRAGLLRQAAASVPLPDDRPSVLARFEPARLLRADRGLVRSTRTPPGRSCRWPIPRASRLTRRRRR